MASRGFSHSVSRLLSSCTRSGVRNQPARNDTDLGPVRAPVQTCRDSAACPAMGAAANNWRDKVLVSSSVVAMESVGHTDRYHGTGAGSPLPPRRTPAASPFALFEG